MISSVAALKKTVLASVTRRTSSIWVSGTSLIGVPFQPARIINRRFVSV